MHQSKYHQGKKKKVGLSPGNSRNSNPRNTVEHFNKFFTEIGTNTATDLGGGGGGV